MKLSHFFSPTLKEKPSDASITSHRLMLRAGLIRQVTAGVYNWLPAGLKTLKKVTAIVRKEMDASGAQEILMPVLQPAEFWKKSGRWDDYGPELYRLTDRNDRDYVLGPTHEEVITVLAQQELNSYKQLPLHFYQIQTKFRDEIRPRFGVMRSREFIMKDGYSFHSSIACLDEEFARMYDTYSRIFDSLGLNYQAVEADSGSIGGSKSIEFHALTQTGEDAIAISDNGYAVNVEKAKTLPTKKNRPKPKEDLVLINTPEICTLNKLSDYLSITSNNIVKVIIVHASKYSDSPFVALLLRGDHQLNTVKANSLSEVSSPLRFATQKEIQNEIGLHPDFIGPVNLNIPIIIDYSVAEMSDFISGANQVNKHYKGINWDRDCQYLRADDLRNVVDGDPCPQGPGIINITRGVELGHIFRLGQKYSNTFNATILDHEGKSKPLHMGCYGIGITRVIAAIIEQNHDKRGIIWPESVAPFPVIMVPLKMHKSTLVKNAAEALYSDLKNNAIDVLLDDRKMSIGAQLADSELIGVPHRIIISETLLEKQKIEYQHRSLNEKIEIPLDQIIQFLKKNISHN